MRKIFTDKREGVAAVIEKIISDPEAEIILVVPRGAELKESATNFHLIRREAEAAGKTVLVESVDDEVLALAKSARLEAIHPLFSGKSPGRSLSDIVPRGRDGAGREEKSEEEGVEVRRMGRKKIREEARGRGRHARAEAEAIEEIREEASPTREEEPILIYRHRGSDRGLDRAHREPPERSFRFNFKIRRLKLVGAIFFGAVIIGLIFFAGGRALGKADIAISFKKTPWQYQNKITAKVSIAKIDPAGSSIPSEVFRQSKNITKLFPASGKSKVSQKAAGKMTIYNSYSSERQVLVSTTRFVTPDGKVFRIDNQVVVPGAEIRDGKIIPSSIATSITADQPGPDYNVGPIDRLSVPGFKGTPKYAAFYGSITEPISGGFVGEKAVPTDADIRTATDETQEVLKSSLNNKLLNNLPEEFKILDGASETAITKLNVSKNTDPSGNFSVFGEAQFRAVGFKESDLKSFLLAMAAGDNQNLTLGDDLEIDYRDVKKDFDKGQLNFTVEAKGNLRPTFSADDFRKKILGQDAAFVQSEIKKLPDFTDAKISLWPFWVTKVPTDPKRVDVAVN